MRRRGVGIGAVQASRARKDQYENVGNSIAKVEERHITSELASFKESLTSFATNHRDRIRTDPEFRTAFNVLCSRIGVDPLASTKGFWSSLLDVGDFYYELAIRVIEVGIETRSLNGGLLKVSDALVKLQERSSAKTSEDDIIRAVKKLSVLGDGFKLISNDSVIVTRPMILSDDHSSVLALASSSSSSCGFVSALMLRQEMKWEAERCDRVLEDLMKQGVVWVDKPHNSECLYYFPSLTLKHLDK